jgi:hypothetical protein
MAAELLLASGLKFPCQIRNFIAAAGEFQKPELYATHEKT